MPMRLPEMRRPSIHVGDPLVRAIGKHPRAFDHAARHGEHESHGDVGAVLSQHIGRVGDGNALSGRGIHIHMVDTVGEAGDEFQLRSCLLNHRCGDAVGNGGHEHVYPLHGGDKLCLAARRIVYIQFGIEEFAHSGFDDVRQFAGYIDCRSLLVGHRLPLPCSEVINQKER